MNQDLTDASRPPGQSREQGLRHRAVSLLAWPVALILSVGMSTLGYHTPWWVNGLIFLIVGRVGTVIGNLAIRSWLKGGQHLAPSGLDVQRSDTRAPVLYLRSFSADDLTSHTVPGRTFASYRTDEQQIARAFKTFGPVLAIGRPGEQLPMVGAARSYVSGDEWQQIVLEMIKKAGLIVVAAGEGAGLMWEIEQIAAWVAPENVVVFIPFGRESYDSFRSVAEPYFGHMLPVWIPGKRRSSTAIRAAVYFDADWTAHFVRLDSVKRRSLEQSCRESLPVFYRRSGT
jgi:hypothetical protein